MNKVITLPPMMIRASLTENSGRHGGQDQRGEGRVPSHRRQGQHPLLPDHRDVNGELHVPDLAEAVPTSV